MFLTKPRNHWLLLLVIVTPFTARALPDFPNRPLIFGFLPSRSPVALFKQYTPLREYLSQQLKRPVVLETAPDYPAFLLSTRNRKYDFVLTAPHFVLLATDSGKYDAPVTYTNALMADILVPKTSPITDVRQLAGKKVSIPPESAIINMAGKRFLTQHGLAGSLRPKYVITNSHNASIHAMLAGDTAAAIVSVNVTRQFRQNNIPLKKIATTTALPGMAFLVARDLPKELRQSFVSALVQMNKKPVGKVALKKMGYPGYRKTYRHEFEAARPYLDIYTGSLKPKRQ